MNVLPSVSLEPLLDVLSEGDVGVSVDGDVVVVVDGDEVSELEVTVERKREEYKEVSSSREGKEKLKNGRRRCTQRGKQPQRRHPPGGNHLR